MPCEKLFARLNIKIAVDQHYNFYLCQDQSYRMEAIMNRRDIVLHYFDENREFMDFYIKAQIEKNRKGNLNITVKDKDGKPVRDAKIVIKQKTHEFKYGANIFMLDEFESDEKNQIYREEFPKCFNLATVPFYWDEFEPEQGKPRFAADSEKIYRRPPSDLCVNYCLEKGIEPKCHCLNYDNFLPSWLKDADVDTHKRMLDKRFRELAERYRDVIPSWEVTNETLNHPTRYQSRFYKEDDFVEWSFRTADKYFPTNRLIINDYQLFESAYRENRSQYYMQVERLLNNGITHLDSIGIQFHSFFPKEMEKTVAQTRYNPLYLYEVLDKYAQLGKKIQITEMTIPAFSDSEEDEYVQAELIKNVYTLFFSHPAMEAIIYWNVVDGYAAFAPLGDMSAGENTYHGGIRRFDLTEKPASKVIKELFSKVWHTETDSVTDPDGKARLHGFYGEYTMEIFYDGRVKTLDAVISSKRNNVMEVQI